jgi:4-amino-4-deoxy-L-arabinose transferase-like glycosyltransferase
MKIAMVTKTNSQAETLSVYKADLLQDLKWLALLVIGIAVVNMLWFSFDFHFPTQDEAEHIMNSIVGKDLLRHFHPWSGRWWHQVLTINCFYPPFAYLVNGLFMLIFGQSRFTEQLSLSFFLCLAAGSVYGIVRLLNGNRLAAGLSAFILVAYPLIAHLGHSFFLDLPEVAMTALSLMTLLWWRNSNIPSWKKTALTALVLGISCLTKQLVAAFLLPVGVYLLIDYCGWTYPFKKPRWDWLRHIITMGIITAAIGLPFLLVN